MKRSKRFLHRTSLVLLTIALPTAVLAQANPGQGGAAINRSPKALPSPADIPAPGAGGPVNLNDGAQATQMLNVRVNNRQNETLGTIRDFAIDLPSGRVAYVLVSSPGLAVHPVPPEALSFDPAHGNVVFLDLPKERFANSPGFQDQMPATFSQDDQIRQVYSYYNQQWSGRAGFSPTGRAGQAGTALPAPTPANPPAPGGATPAAAAGDLTLATRLLGQNVTLGQQQALGLISDVFINLKNGSSALIVSGAQAPAGGGTPP